MNEDRAYLNLGMGDIQPWLALADNAGIMRYLLDKILPRFHFEGRLLEIGAGLGLASALIKLEYPTTEVIASDVSATILRKGMEVCKLLNSKADWYMLADGESLPFSSELFDFVLGSRVLHHFLKPQKGVAEIYRVLKKGGVYIGVAEPTLSRLLQPLWNWFYIGYWGRQVGIRENTYTFGQWVKLFRDCGFQDIKTDLDRDWRHQEHNWLCPFYFRVTSFIPEPLMKAFLGSRVTITAVKR